MRLAVQNKTEIKSSSRYMNSILQDVPSNLNLNEKDRKAIIGISRFGKGLLANECIKRNSLITKITGRPMQFNEAVLLGDKESYPFQINLFEYIAPKQNEIWQYINHSCNPNCGVNENLEIIALRNIKKGEELFYDYSTCMLERHWTMQCQCSSKNCRQSISDFDSLPLSKQKKYIQLGIVQKFIKKFLNL